MVVPPELEERHRDMFGCHRDIFAEERHPDIFGTPRRVRFFNQFTHTTALVPSPHKAATLRQIKTKLVYKVHLQEDYISHLAMECTLLTKEREDTSAVLEGILIDLSINNVRHPDLRYWVKGRKGSNTRVEEQATLKTKDTRTGDIRGLGREQRKRRSPKR